MSNSKLIQSLVIIGFVSIFGIAGFFVWRSVSDSNPLFTKQGGEVDKTSGPSGQRAEAGEQTYTHPDYGFTLKYPAGFTLGKFAEGDGEIVLVQGKNSGEGFQIFISSYAEEEEFSKDIILKADSKMKIENDKTVSLGTEGISALVFDSTDDTGATHEVWFVVDGYLYQATSFSQYGGEMEKIIKTIRFN